MVVVDVTEIVRVQPSGVASDSWFPSIALMVIPPRPGPPPWNANPFAAFGFLSACWPSFLPSGAADVAGAADAPAASVRSGSWLRAPTAIATDVATRTAMMRPTSSSVSRRVPAPLRAAGSGDDVGWMGSWITGLSPVARGSASARLPHAERYRADGLLGPTIGPGTASSGAPRRQIRRLSALGRRLARQGQPEGRTVARLDRVEHEIAAHPAHEGS